MTSQVALLPTQSTQVKVEVAKNKTTQTKITAMELHPILEAGDMPLCNIWYVVSSGSSPCSRVGQACVYEENCKNLYVIGGADPSVTYNDVFRLNLLSQQWTKLPVDNLCERYEHCAMAPAFSSDTIYVFGGANKTDNLNSVQVIDTTSNICKDVNCNGSSPSPRTTHCAGFDNDLLYVWGGGHQGANPVNDMQLHIFDCSTHSWLQPTVRGKLPSPRHGHIMALVEKNLFIHGGMSGPTFHKDMHVVNILDFSCSKVKPRGTLPSPRAAHAACVYSKAIYIFGGVSSEGALDDMYRFNTATHSWSKLTFDCPPPTPRLDHSMVFAYLPCVKKQEVSESSSVVTSQPADADSVDVKSPNIIPVDLWGSNGDAKTVVETSGQLTQLHINPKETELVPVCIVFGGMDTSGNIFNDLLVYRLPLL